VKHPDQHRIRYFLWPAAAVFSITTACYMAAICPGVYWLDSGEFQAAVPTLGIPHSPSFPSYILSTHLICRLPLGDVAFRVNIASALAGAMVGVLSFFLAFILFGLHSHRNMWPALFTGLAVTLNPLFWFQNLKAEVYSLNTAWLLIILICSVDLMHNTHDRQRMFRNLNIIAVMFGLGATNHSLLTAHLAPAAAVMCLFVIRKFKPGEILFSCQVAILTLSAYLYLPVRAAKNPMLNTGNPENIMNFFNAVTRRGTYHRFMGNMWTDWTHNWFEYIQLMRDHFSWPFLVFSVAGLAVLMFRRFKPGLILIIAAFTNISVTLMNRNFNMNPDTGPAYLMLSTIILIIGLGYAFQLLLGICDHTVRRPAVSTALIAGIFLIPAMWSHENLKTGGLSHDTSAALVTKGLLDICPNDSLLFYGVYFNIPFVVSYLQAVENYRADVMSISRGEIVYWPAGLEKVARTYPELMKSLFEGAHGDSFRYLAGRSARHSKDIPYDTARDLLFNASAWVAREQAAQRCVFWFASEDDHLLRIAIHPHGPMLLLGADLRDDSPVLHDPAEVLAARVQKNLPTRFPYTKGAEVLGAFYDLQCATLHREGFVREAGQAKKWSEEYDPGLVGYCTSLDL
jgi:hypothetical protein